jgi:hypothetical protein
MQADLFAVNLPSHEETKILGKFFNKVTKIAKFTKCDAGDFCEAAFLYLPKPGQNMFPPSSDHK